MKIEILGAGCSNCTKLAKNAEDAVKASGIDCEVEKVTDYGRIMGYGVMSTPALVIDGIVKSVGRMLSVDEIKKMINV
jgi:small redox-active disulfide protein 2